MKLLPWRRQQEFVGAMNDNVPNWGRLRTVWQRMGARFYPTRPLFDDTFVNYDLARQLYRNDGSDTALGAFFCKPIVDACVNYMGIPTVSSEDEERDNDINDAITIWWADDLQQAFRNMLRDSKCWVRICRPDITDPLVDLTDLNKCYLQVIEPERVSVKHSITNQDFIERLILVHYVLMEQEDINVLAGQMPSTKQHEIWEIVTPDSYTYWDNTDKVELPQYGRANLDGFVPFVEMLNEEDSSLSDGQSEFEGLYPFVKAFHDVLHDSLLAHKYHSIPKVHLKIQDLTTFLRNNFPGVMNEDGSVNNGATVDWKGREMIFTRVDEDIEFLEVKSVLGDSKTLLEFLFYCICVASQTPPSAFMWAAVMGQGAVNAETLPFEKKVERKRTMVKDYVQRLVKMYLAMNGEAPVTVDLHWQVIRTDDLVNKGQAMQQIMAALEFALTRGLIADDTVREIMRQWFPQMHSPSVEKNLAKSNANPDQQLIDAQANAQIKVQKAAPKPTIVAPPASGNGQQGVPPSRTPTGNAKGGKNE